MGIIVNTKKHAVRLTYHEIGEPSSEYRYGVGIGRLRQHLEEITAINAGSPDTLVEVSFDDGHMSHRELVMPILAELGLNATFFITAGWTGMRAGYMNKEQLCELSGAGYLVQSHAWSHKMLTLCNDQELREELVRSKASLEDITGKCVDSISAPNGRWDIRVVEAAAEAGYVFLYTSDSSIGETTRRGVQIRGRRMVTSTLEVDTIRGLCDSSWFRNEWERFGGVSKKLLRQLLGEQRYHNIWCRLARRDGEW